MNKASSHARVCTEANQESKTNRNLSQGAQNGSHMKFKLCLVLNAFDGNQLSLGLLSLSEYFIAQYAISTWSATWNIQYSTIMKRVCVYVTTVYSRHSLLIIYELCI